MKRRAEPAPTEHGRRRCGYASPPRLGRECRRSITIGAANGVLLAAIAGASAGPAMLAALGGAVAGALIGVLLWSGSDAVPEDRVPPPGTR